MNSKIVLGVETSCDETSVAVLRGSTEILGHVILSQDIHEVYGGVVPELAARAHLQRIGDVAETALREAALGLDALDAVAVTTGPGLIGALLVGVGWAKGVSYGLGIPLVPVHHMEGHLFAPSLENPDAEPPFVALLVSGGHTLLLHCEEWGRYTRLGSTRDDAAGEAFDKVAKVLGLSYPGGPEIQRLAESGDPNRYDLPRPMVRGRSDRDDAYFDFSFSGLKTAVATEVERVRKSGRLEEERPHLAASFEEAAVDVLCTKLLRAVEETGCPRVLLGGGVSANRKLRTEVARRLGEGGAVFHSSPRLAVDNGAMIARAGLFRLEKGDVGDGSTSADANLPFPGVEPWRPDVDTDGTASYRS